MDDKKLLVALIVKFLRSEIERKYLNEDASESLEVSADCIEQAYDLEGFQPPDGEDLLTVFKNSKKDKKPVSSPSDMAAAEEFKLKGNNLMKEGKCEEAISCYSSAILLDGNNAVYYCNRAAAYTKLEKNDLAIEDCNKAIAIDPNYGKAYGRMGLSYMNEKKFPKAVEMYEKAVLLEPNNESYRTNLNLAKEQKSNQQQRPAPNPLSGLDISSLLSNPAVMNMAQSFMQNPAMQNMFSSMMGGGPPPPSGQIHSHAPDAQEDGSGMEQGESEPQQSEQQDGTSSLGAPGGISMPQGLDFNSILNATQQVAEQLRTQNPELAESLRSQFQGHGQNPQQPPQQPPPDNSNA